MEEKDFEPAGLIPRSIIRTVERFRQQLRPETVALAMKEFRISRYQVRVSVRYFFILLLLPGSLNWGAKTLIITPLVQYFWNTYSTELFLNTYQAERAFQEMRDFESQLLFEILLSNRTQDNCSQLESLFSAEGKNYKSDIESTILSKSSLEDLLFRPQADHSDNLKPTVLLGAGAMRNEMLLPSKEHNPQKQSKKELQEKKDKSFCCSQLVGPTANSNCEQQKLFQEKTVLLAEIYNQQSISAVSNMFGDLVMITSTVLLLRWNAPQFTILKSFLIESFYSFNDAIKSFYIILVTDFLVGFHSPRGWEITMEMLLRHLGLPEDEEFILLFVGTFPVFLDTAFKYWIFRYLNKISPSTVATYHNMIE